MLFQNTANFAMQITARARISFLILLGLCTFQLKLRWPSSILRMYFTSEWGDDHTSIRSISDATQNATNNFSTSAMQQNEHSLETQDLLLETPLLSKIINVSNYCRKMIQTIAAKAGTPTAHYFSFPSLLQAIQPVVLNATFQHIVDNVWAGVNPSEEHRTSLYGGLDRLLQMLDSDRLRRALMNRMPMKTATKIMDIIEKRLVDPVNNPPLRVMIFGGSVVEGVEANFYHQGNASIAGFKHTYVNARFSSQLQTILDTVIFPGVVEITNMASGGLTSNVALPLLEYCIYPPGYPRQGPDLIISSFGFNDVHMFAESSDMRAANEDFLEAAYLNRCDGLPAVVLVDDVFSHIWRSFEHRESVRVNLMHSRMVSDMARWNDVMAVSYTQAFMHFAYSDPTMEDPAGMRKYREILFGGASPSTHPYIMFHSGMAFLLAFQLLQTMVDSCHDEVVNGPPLRPTSESAVDYDELDPRLMPRYADEDTLADITRKWHNRSDTFVNRCSDPDFRPGNTCSLSLVVHRSSTVKAKRHLRNLLRLFGGTEDNGWSAQGNPVKRPRTGWVATRANASFSLNVVATEFPIRKVTFVYMKSYGDAWKDSRVNVSLTVLNGTTNDASVETYGELEGIHNSTTSVNYKTSFEVDAKVGDTVKADFVLVGGTTFKFTGMLFCSR